MRESEVDNRLIPIDLEDEVRALVLYAAPRWGVAEADLQGVIAHICRRAQSIACAWFEYHEPFFALLELSDKRGAALKEVLPEGRARDSGALYDSICRQLSQMSFGARDFRESALALNAKGERWDFSDQTAAIRREVVKLHPFMSAIKPLGWDDKLKDYEDFDGMGDWDRATEEAAFDGHRDTGARSIGVVESLSLPQVMYNKVGQGRGVDYSFVSAIFGHFLFCMTHNNTAAMTQEIKGIDLSNTPAEVLFGPRLVFAHKLLSSLSDASAQIGQGNDSLHSCEKYHEYLHAPVRAPGPRSEEESRAFLNEMITKIREEEANGEAQRKTDQELAIYRKHLRDAFSTIGPGSGHDASTPSRFSL